MESAGPLLTFQWWNQRFAKHIKHIPPINMYSSHQTLKCLDPKPYITSNGTYYRGVTFPVCMNSFSISLCPFTGASSSFKVFTFWVFRESFRDFGCLLLDLELKDWGGKVFLRCRCILKVLHADVTVALLASRCISEQLAMGETHHPNPLPDTKDRKSVV